MSKKKAAPKPKTPKALVPSAKSSPTALLAELRNLIDAGRAQVAQAVNAGLTLLYWSVGDRIRREILREKRADYGQEILATVSHELTVAYGSGFTVSALSRMMRLAECFPDREILSTLSAKLGWSHFVEIIPMGDPLKRDFYVEMCRLERWSVRTLRDRIKGMLYERTAISRKPEETIRQELSALRDADRITPELVFRDPYVLDFLGLKDAYSEKDLETAILRELEAFLLELGGDFAFVARQKRITVDATDYYLDLLFYHRRLRRLIAVELKLDKLTPADAGQVQLYLAWLRKHETRPGEESPLGLILCAEKGTEQIELLELESGGIRVAEYLTELPDRSLLAGKLHDAIRLARHRLTSKQ